MSPDCVFCKIAKGEIPAKILHQDEHTTAFLDQTPLRKGHTLVIPNRHYDRLEQLSEDGATAYLGSLPKIVQAVTKAVDADGATVAWNNAPAAGQEVPHVHAHIVPRTEGDGVGPIHGLFKGSQKVSDAENDELVERAQTLIRA